MNDRFRGTLLAAGCASAAYLLGRAALTASRRCDFRNRVVLITGGSRGLGLLLARQFIAEGAHVAICARDDEELEAALADLRSRGGRAMAVACDLTSAGAIADLIETVRDELGPIDVLVNNAGVIQVGPAELMTPEDFEQAMALHFWAPFHAMRHVLPDMRRRGAGRIVNISSIGGKISVPHLLPYCASKFALVGLSQGMRCELAQEGIYVTTVCPGLMRTGSPRQGQFKGQHRAEYAWFSISGSLPGVSMNADRAARQIVSACRYGRAEVTLSMPAKLAAMLNSLFPELVADARGLANALLPAAIGNASTAFAGSESKSAWSPSWLTVLTEQAAARNNELRQPRPK